MQRSDEHYRFGYWTNFHGHFCPVAVKWIEKHNTSAKMIRHRLPRDPPIGNAHHNLDLTFHFLPIDHRSAREAGVTDLVDVGDWSDEPRKIFETEATTVNFSRRGVDDDRLAIGVHVSKDRRRFVRRLLDTRQFILRRFHLPSCSACSRASSWLQPPPKLKSSRLRMSHGLRTILDRREKMRLRFARLGLSVFITLCVTSPNYELWEMLATKQSVDLLLDPEREFFPPPLRDVKPPDNSGRALDTERDEYQCIA